MPNIVESCLSGVYEVLIITDIFRRKLLKSWVFHYNFNVFGCGQSAKTTHTVQIGHWRLRRKLNLLVLPPLFFLKLWSIALTMNFVLAKFTLPYISIIWIAFFLSYNFGWFIDKLLRNNVSNPYWKYSWHLWSINLKQMLHPRKLGQFADILDLICAISYFFCLPFVLT